MYHLFLGIQYGSILVIWACMIKVFNSRHSDQQMLLLMLLLSNIFNMLGTALNMQAKTMEAALVGLKIAYFGKVYVALFILFFVLHYCRIKTKNWLVGVITLLHTAILVTVWTCDRNTLYYKSMTFTEEGMFPHIEIEPGIFHVIFISLMIIYTLIILVLGIMRLRKTANRKERGGTYCLIVLPVVMIFAYVLFKLELFDCYDCTNLSYVIDTAILSFALNKFDLIDYVALAKEEIVDELSDGIVVLDSMEKIVYFNRQMTAIMPEVPQHNDATELKKIVENFEKHDGSWIDDRHYICRVKNNSVEVGESIDIITFTDNTDNYILTYVDGLTGVNNRRALTKAMEEYEPVDNSYLVIMDIDNFKSINDTYGHQVGDECLIRFAGTLAAHFGKNSVFRFGGDEFVMLVDMETAELEKHFEAVNVELTDEGSKVAFHTSGGYVAITPDASLENLMKKVDDALYTVKKSGKGRFARG